MIYSIHFFSFLQKNISEFSKNNSKDNIISVELGRVTMVLVMLHKPPQTCVLSIQLCVNVTAPPPQFCKSQEAWGLKKGSRKLQTYMVPLQA